jgi:hypothetical protein
MVRRYSYSGKKIQIQPQGYDCGGRQTARRNDTVFSLESLFEHCWVRREGWIGGRELRRGSSSVKTASWMVFSWPQIRS